jgi:hypothetical protein
MAALVECETVVVVAQGEAAQIPAMRGERGAMQEEDRRLAQGPPLEIAQAQSVDRDPMLVRQDHVIETEAGAHRSRSQMFAVFLTSRNFRNEEGASI